MLSKTNQAVIQAFEKGYRVINGEVYYKDNKLNPNVNANKYFVFCLRLKSGERYPIGVHKLVAYQKFKDKMFEKGIEVRHLDSDSLNNLEENIDIGTATENANDKLPSVRRVAALRASSFIKIHPHDSIIKRRKEGATYKELMKEFNVSSKGTISFIINKSESVGNR